VLGRIVLSKKSPHVFHEGLGARKLRLRDSRSA
jgi:hypothetical protein